MEGERTKATTIKKINNLKKSAHRNFWIKCGQMDKEFTCLSSPVEAKGGTECPRLAHRSGPLRNVVFFKKRQDQTGKVV